ncbi:MAG: carbamoyltransferase HypF, partial [Planctomycetota bacterium]
MASGKDKRVAQKLNKKSSNSNMRRAAIRVCGIVQGVGFRPFVYRIAHKYKITGNVRNDTLGVFIEAQGKESDITHFVTALEKEYPPLSLIESIEIEDIHPIKEHAFTILKSAKCKTKETLIPPDIATCNDCLNEIFDRVNRRFFYPFTNCTNCGPRYTIIKDLPYDRPITSMSIFKMCAACRKEYDSPDDRRFHAQPNACAVCGPHLTLTSNKNVKVDCRDAVSKTNTLLKKGAIFAIKGLGGFHLACDAANEKAVAKLRKRKNRLYKPFAVMSQDIESVLKYAFVSDKERELLQSYRCPIVLLRKKPKSPLSEQIAPHISEIGVMLPYTPLHHLVIKNNFTALVMTSGNISDEPTIASNEKALEKLAHIADYFLFHNRDILIQNDDSIVKVMNNTPVILRRARGYVPEPIKIPAPATKHPDILAVGAEEKNTVCFVRHGQAFLSQHLGDLKNKESVESFENTTKHLERILQIKLKIIAHDLHPLYSNSKSATSLSNVTLVPAQHHFAHIAACLAENMINEKVIGISFDGLGLGTDGKIWGGEFLIADLSDFQRVAHLKYLPLPGADAASKETYRVAVSYLNHAFGDKAPEIALKLLKEKKRNIEMIFNLINRKINSPLSSSMGRLFDAVGALIGICTVNTYEGQAPMELESLIYTEPLHNESYPFTIETESEMLIIDTAPMICKLVNDVEKKISTAHISGKFHNTVAQFTLAVCEKMRSIYNLNKTALSGGVFQNKYLTEKLISLLEKNDFIVYTHKLVPPNDGGLSLG